MLKRFLLLAIFSSLFVFSNAAQTSQKSLKQLKANITSAKSVGEELSARIELIDYWAQVDTRKWKEEIQSILASRSHYPSQESQQQIDILSAEYDWYSGNMDQFKSILSNRLKKGNGLSVSMKFRLNRLWFDYELTQENWSQAKAKADSAIQTSRKQRNNANTSLIYQDLSHLYMKMSIRDSAFWASDRAISLAKRSQRREMLILALQNQANTHGYFLDLEGAVQKELQAIRLAEELHLEAYKIHSFLEIAKYSSFVGNWTEALGYLKRALQLAREYHDDQAIAFISLHFSKVYLHQNQLTLSLYHARKSERYFKSESDVYHMAQCAHSI
ncbi:MAG: hypothetical protein ACKOXP_11420, partial [Flavobacteriales bacterium]